MIEEPSAEEIAQAATILAKLRPGYLPEPLFDQITRLHVSSTIVIVALRKGPAGKLEVLLVQRRTGPTEPVWPGHWHLPGTMLRPTDTAEGYNEPFKRLLSETGELKGTPTEGQPLPLRTAFVMTKRGPELTQVFRLKIAGEPKEGGFFPVDRLPELILEHEIPYIQEAAAQFSD